MTSATPDRLQPSPNAERLRIALGWDRLPEMTAEQREAFDAELRRRDAALRRFYGEPIT